MTQPHHPPFEVAPRVSNQSPPILSRILNSFPLLQSRFYVAFTALLSKNLSKLSKVLLHFHFLDNGIIFGATDSSFNADKHMIRAIIPPEPRFPKGEEIGFYRSARLLRGMLQYFIYA